MYLGDFKEDGDIYFKFTTRAFATGVPTTLAGSPVLSVYKDEGGAATEKTTAETYFDLDVDHDSIAGFHNVRIDLSGDAFFATGADYAVVITTGTVGGVNVFGETLFTFSIENRSMGQPAGATLSDDIAAIKAETLSLDGTKVPQTLNLTASGNIGIDWANVENPTTALDLSATDIQLVDTVTTLTNLPTIPANWLTAAGTHTDFGTEIATAVGTQQMTESYAANGVAPTRDEATFAIHQMLMQFGIASTSITVRELDDTTTAFVVTLDDATTPTDAKRV